MNLEKKTRLILRFSSIAIIVLLASCGRKMDPLENVVNDYVFEKDGIYYSVNCSSHSNYKKYTGTDTIYLDNGKIKAISIVKNGLPEGHWVKYNNDGTKSFDLYFEKGKLIRKVLGQ